MDKEQTNILIIGKGAEVTALAKKISQYPQTGKIFIAPGNGISSDIYENIDFREDDLTGLLKFALENKISLTIPISEKALSSDIVGFFSTNGQNIFGPSKDAGFITLNKSAGKKFLYKIHAQTSKFGIFDKQQMAEDYLKNANFPVTIKSSEYTSSTDDRLVCPTVSLAREFLTNLFSKKNETDVLIEEFIYGKNFTIYFITDGYSAVPITSVGNYKFMQDGDGGILTNGIGCYTPDYKISEVVISRVHNIVKNTLATLEKNRTPYLGILGVECTLTGEDKFYVNEFKPFFQEHDIASVLSLIEDDLIKMFISCINGFFSDEYESIKLNNLSSISATVLSKQLIKKIKGFDNIDDLSEINFINVQKTNNNEYLTTKGACFTVTKTASTLSRAKKCLYEDLGMINFDGLKYRKDICKELNNFN